MAKLLVLINGLPGSGKTTLGGPLAKALNAHFLSKDAAKEAFSPHMADHSTLGSTAMTAVWALARAIPTTVVIDSWWFKPRDLAFAQAGIEHSHATHAIEVWCDIPPALARRRYENRHRPAFYQDAERLAQDWDLWAAQATPLGLTPTVLVDTTTPVNHPDLAERIREAAAR
ncbi:AAA family ATPase [Nocardia sp. NPDC056000]|uniref:AAA family ATPase n=1 Tax=Nocardia sp. NPDC056000 TaxID=3345674 RepID=UPI0035D71C51